MGAEIEITDEAAEAGAAALEGYPIASSDCWDAASEVLRAAAPLIVAGELGRLADEMAMRTVTEEDVRARIAQLTGKADQWCNCQAIRGTVNYPGPWHPRGDAPSCCIRASELRGEG